MGLFLHISMATMTTFPGTSFIIKKINWVELGRKFSFDAMPSPNIPGSGVSFTNIVAVGSNLVAVT